MKLKEIMTKEVETVRPDNTLQEAAQKMRIRDVGFLPVCEDDQFIGVLTDRDIVLRTTAEGMDPNKTIGRELITSPVVHCYEDQDVQEAARLMEEHQVRRVVVLSREDDRLAGVVSLGDLAKSAAKETSADVLQSVSEPTV